MTRESDAAQQAARLLDALSAPDDVTCEQARAQVPDLVDAERAGQDVDEAPEYVALLQHLGSCEDCTALYAELAEDLEALLGEEEVLPQIRPAAPAFFAPARDSESVVLRVLRGLTRRFELTLAPPQLAPAIATLSGGQQANLFNDRLGEVKGEPFVVVTANVDEGRAAVRVAIREASAEARWRVRLTAGDIERAAITGAQGSVQFDDLPVAGLQELTLYCAELLAES
jgi:hypothetical protein